MHGDLDEPDLSLADLFRLYPQAAGPFLRHRMACVGCPIARFHTIRDACAEYAVDEAAFRAEIRAAVRPRRSGPRDDAALSP